MSFPLRRDLLPIERLRKEWADKRKRQYEDPDKDVALERVYVGWQWNARKKIWILLGFVPRRTKVTARALRRLRRKFKPERKGGPVFICSLREAVSGHAPTEPPRKSMRLCTAPDTIDPDTDRPTGTPRQKRRRVRDRALKLEETQWVALGQKRFDDTETLYLGPCSTGLTRKEAEKEADRMFGCLYKTHVVALAEYKGLRRRARKGRLVPGVTQLKRNVPV